jgi:large subunit ribosomal protein L23
MKGMPLMSNVKAQHSELYALLKRPIVTEKTTNLATLGQYVFEVTQNANKIQLAQAFEMAFPGRKVKAVRLVTVPARTKRYGRRIGQTQEKRKAIFSIEGEPIELFTGV